MADKTMNLGNNSTSVDLKLVKGDLIVQDTTNSLLHSYYTGHGISVHNADGSNFFTVYSPSKYVEAKGELAAQKLIAHDNDTESGIYMEGNSLNYHVGDQWGTMVITRREENRLGIGQKYIKFEVDDGGTLMSKSEKSRFYLTNGTSHDKQLSMQDDSNLVYVVDNVPRWSTNSSSRRYKHNIKDMTEDRALKLLKMRPVTFDFNDGIPCCTNSIDKAGFIAEEIEKIVDDLVIYEATKGGEKIPNSIQYEGLTPYLVKLCQMQQKQIDELTARIEKLEKGGNQ